MISNSYKTLKKILDSNRVAFVVYGRLVDEKFAIVPSVNNIIGTITKALGDLTNVLKSMPRWLRTTDIRCPVLQHVETGETHLPYSFYNRAVINCEHLIDVEKQCQYSIKKISDRLDDMVRKYIYEFYAYLYSYS